MMNFFIPMLLISLFSLQTWANELDPVVEEIPHGVVVRVSPEGMREVFKSDLTAGVVENADSALVELAASVKEENKVESVLPVNELDQVSSDESWYWVWNAVSAISSGYYSYQYHCRSGNSNYYPSYSYSNGGYQYTYYYSSNYYSQYGSRYGRGNSCGSQSDNYGYHYGRGYGWHGRGH